MYHDNDRSKIFTRRALMLAGGKAALVGTLAARMYYLQVVESDKYTMLAEDNRVNQQLILEYLRRVEAKVTVVDNGREAVEQVAEQPFDVILMDLQMPVLDGLEATIAIRALQRADAEIPIIAMTANTFPEDIQACLNAGMNGHVGKPVDPRHLYQTLLKVLQY